MRFRKRSRRSSGRRLRRMRTARMRLTLLYSGMFLLLGTTVIVIIVVLTGQSALVVHVGGSTTASAAPTAVARNVLIRPPNVAIAQHNADFGRLFTVSWAVLAITTVGSAVLGWFAAGRVLRPLRSITATARTISAGNLHERLALAGPEDEFKALGDTLDDLLARLEGSFEAQRRFVANASHELRTPLTLERTLLQVALADPNASAQTLRATGQELLELQGEHERMLEALLTLASSERGLERRDPVDLAAMVEVTLRRLHSAIEAKHLQLETSLDGSAATTGDCALIERMIANLIDNGIEHNIEQGHLKVRTAADGAGQAVLTVSSTGPQIPPDQVARLFEPFQRLNGARAGSDGHHGLGLSIVRAIATAHGADLVTDARPGGGLTVTVRFPASLTPRSGSS